MKSNPVEYTITVLGAAGVGKSTLCIQFCQSKFQQDYEPTIEDYYRRPLTINGVNIMLDILDTAGSEQSDDLNYAIQQAQGVLIVFDITDKQSFYYASDLRDRVVFLKDRNFPLILVGSKCDLIDKRKVSQGDAYKYIYMWNCKYIETSAKNNQECDTVFMECTKEIIKYKLTQETPTQRNCCAIF